MPTPPASSPDNPRSDDSADAAFPDTIRELSDWAVSLRGRQSFGDANLKKGAADVPSSRVAIWDTEARLNLILKSTSMGTFLWNVAEGRGEPDDQMRALLGLTAEEPFTLQRVVEVIHPGDRDRCAHSLMGACEEEGETYFEENLRVVDSEGGTRWLRVTGEVYCEGAPPVAARIAAAAIDITARMQVEEILRANERRQTFLLSFGDALRPLRSALEIQETAASLLAAHLEADWVGYAEVLPGRDEIRIVPPFSCGVPALQGVFGIGSYGQELLGALREGHTVIRHDIQADPTLTAEVKSAHHHLLVGATFHRPLVEDGGLLAVFCVYYRRAHSFRADEIALIEEIADRAWASVVRARYEAALAVSGEKYRTLFESIDQGFCLIDVIFDAEDKPVDYHFLETNPAFEHQTGLRDAIGRSMRELAANHEGFWYETYGRIARSRQPERFEHSAEALGRVYDVYAFPVDPPDSHRVAILFNDISERKCAEAALDRVREDLEIRVAERTKDLKEALEQIQIQVAEERRLEEVRHDLIRRLVTSQEEERKRISRDLHDNLGQYLTSVMLQLHAIHKEIEERSQDRTPAKRLAELQFIVKSLMEATHRQAWELRPTELDHFGLEAALGSYLRVWSDRTGIPVEFTATGWDDRRIDSECELALYRVAQEALTNIARHAEATQVRVVLEAKHGTEVQVIDDGLGFDTSLASRRLGLLGMRERISLVNGSLEITSEPGQGTCVRAYVERSAEGAEADLLRDLS